MPKEDIVVVYDFITDEECLTILEYEKYLTENDLWDQGDKKSDPQQHWSKRFLGVQNLALKEKGLGSTKDLEIMDLCVSIRKKIKSKIKETWALQEEIYADSLNLQILYQYGGIYSDTDMICVSSFDPLLSKGLSFFAGLEKPGDYYISNLAVCNALIGCAPQHSIISKAMNNQKTLSEAPNYPCNIRTGPGPLSRAIEEFLINSYDENVLILPCTYFYPSYYDITLSVLINKYNSSFPFRKEETMAIHLWDNSWNKP